MIALYYLVIKDTHMSIIYLQFVNNLRSLFKHPGLGILHLSNYLFHCVVLAKILANRKLVFSFQTIFYVLDEFSAAFGNSRHLQNFMLEQCFKASL